MGILFLILINILKNSWFYFVTQSIQINITYVNKSSLGVLIIKWVKEGPKAQIFENYQVRI